MKTKTTTFSNNSKTLKSCIKRLEMNPRTIKMKRWSKTLKRRRSRPKLHLKLLRLHHRLVGGITSRIYLREKMIMNLPRVWWRRRSRRWRRWRSRERFEKWLERSKRRRKRCRCRNKRAVLSHDGTKRGPKAYKLQSQKQLKLQKPRLLLHRRSPRPEIQARRANEAGRAAKPAAVQSIPTTPESQVDPARNHKTKNKNDKNHSSTK